jgi:hypothetical protein
MLVVTNAMPILLWNGSLHLKARRGKKSAFSQVEEEYSIGTDTASQCKVPALVMLYLPVEDRLKRLFLNPKTAELMTWHADCPEKSDGKLRHPSCARKWRTFDSNHKEFRDKKEIYGSR